jgi:hypothetical protein
MRSGWAGAQRLEFRHSARYHMRSQPDEGGRGLSVGQLCDPADSTERRTVETARAHA